MNGRISVRYGTKTPMGVEAMKAIAATLLILASVLVVHFASGASTGDRPPGLDAKNWIPVSDKMGFVVTTPRIFPMPMSDRQVLFLAPPAEGYFMVHMGNVWQGPGTSG